MDSRLNLVKIVVTGDISAELTKPELTAKGVSVELLDDHGFKLHLNREAHVKDVTLRFEVGGSRPFSFYKNGFISWSPSLETDAKYRERRVPWRVLWNHYLDAMYPQPDLGHFFTYLKFPDGCLTLIPKNWDNLVHFRINRDETLDVIVELEQWGAEFSFAGLLLEERASPIFAHKPVRKLFGWTSWYHYYRHIDGAELLRNAKQVSHMPIHLDWFQIDDGWEQAVGDWYENERFAAGLLDAISTEVQRQGTGVGIWLAPFICERRSRLCRQQKDWLLRDDKGKPVVAGFNPLWSGYFYALDITHPQVQSYLFERISYLASKGFELFKFDFLYAGLLPGHWHGASNRYEAFRMGMELLKQASGGGMLLGCGAPVIPQSGLYHILRIGPDTADNWEDKLLKFVGFGGRVSAYNSLRNTITRSLLGNCLFYRDPDVVFLKPKKLSLEERRTIIVVNYLLSDVIFFSDPLYDLTPSDFDVLLMLQKQMADFKLETVVGTDDFYEIKGQCNQGIVTAYVNLSDKPVPVEQTGRELWTAGQKGKVWPHQVRVFVGDDGSLEGR